MHTHVHSSTSAHIRTPQNLTETWESKHLDGGGRQGGRLPRAHPYCSSWLRGGQLRLRALPMLEAGSGHVMLRVGGRWSGVRGGRGGGSGCAHLLGGGARLAGCSGLLLQRLRTMDAYNGCA